MTSSAGASAGSLIKVRYFIDTEYIDREQFVDLISLGMVAEDGREFYAVSTEFDPTHANTFVRDVVIPQLEPSQHPAWMSRVEMKDRLVQFVGSDEPRFWSYAAAPWDWMAIAQLFPVDERVPEGWLYTAYDILQLLELADVAVGDPRLPPPPPDVHHALADARWARELYRAAAQLLA